MACRKRSSEGRAWGEVLRDLERGRGIIVFADTNRAESVPWSRDIAQTAHGCTTR